MRTPAETVKHYEAVMDRGAALSTADWHIYQDAMTEVAREVHRFAWETPDSDLLRKSPDDPGDWRDRGPAGLRPVDAARNDATP